MYCPDCGLEDKQSNQFCRACGTDLRPVRSAIAQPDTITASAASARDEIGRAFAAKIRDSRNPEDLAVVRRRFAGAREVSRIAGRASDATHARRHAPFLDRHGRRTRRFDHQRIRHHKGCRSRFSNLSGRYRDVFYRAGISAQRNISDGSDEGLAEQVVGRRSPASIG